LAGYKAVEWPDVLAVKMCYNDVRPITAVGNEGVYTYRMNSVFDPDFTGVGGQPEGFDQLKALYSRYRVMALGVDVKATSLTSGNAGCIAMAPSENSALSTTAEQLGGLRNARTAEYAFGGGIAHMKALYHIGALLGYSDESVLANTNLDAAISGNPGFQQYLWVQNRDSSATGAIQLTIKLTYYVRMEVPISVVDSLAKVRFAKLRVATQLRALPSASATTPDVVGLSTAASVEPGTAVLPLSTQSLAVLATPPPEKPSQVSVDLRARLKAELERIDSLLALDQQVA